LTPVSCAYDTMAEFVTQYVVTMPPISLHGNGPYLLNYSLQQNCSYFSLFTIFNIYIFHVLCCGFIL